MTDIEMAVNVIDGCFENFGKELEEISPGSTESWMEIHTIASNGYFDMTGEGIYFNRIKINPEDAGPIVEAINAFDKVVNFDFDGILGELRQSVSFRWKSVKKALQEFVVNHMDPEAAYMYSTKVLGRKDG